MDSFCSQKIGAYLIDLPVDRELQEYKTHESPINAETS